MELGIVVVVEDTPGLVVTVARVVDVSGGLPDVVVVIGLPKVVVVSGLPSVVVVRGVPNVVVVIGLPNVVVVLPGLGSVVVVVSGLPNVVVVLPGFWRVVFGGSGRVVVVDPCWRKTGAASFENLSSLQLVRSIEKVNSADNFKRRIFNTCP